MTLDWSSILYWEFAQLLLYLSVSTELLFSRRVLIRTYLVAYKNAHTHTCMHTRTRALKHTPTQCVSRPTHTYHIYICIYTYVFIHMYAYMYMYIYMICICDTHWDTHPHTLIPSKKSIFENPLPGTVEI